jgi:hypothetical protein
MSSVSKETRERLSFLFKAEPHKVAEVMFSVLFQDEENLWLMLSKLIMGYIKDGGEETNLWVALEKVYEVIMHASVYLEVVFKLNADTKAWNVYIWTHGQHRVYLPINNKVVSNLFLLQCIQLLIMMDEFCIRKRDIIGFDMKYSSFNLNPLGNKHFDKMFAIRTLHKKIKETYEQLLPSAQCFDPNMKNTFTNEFIESIKSSHVFTNGEKNEIITAIQSQ